MMQFAAMRSLAIDVDDELYARTFALAETRKTTVPKMVERLLRMATAPLDRSQLPPLTRQALGMPPPTSDEEVRRLLEAEIAQKYDQTQAFRDRAYSPT
jgi:hypothetical protein